jgi:DNA-binding transcriptional regulator YdaS (Cro superfamily)
MNASLHDYISDRNRSEALASACGTKSIYLRHIALGHRKASPSLARLIEQHSGGKVTAQSLRPDIWSPITAEAA